MGGRKSAFSLSFQSDCITILASGDPAEHTEIVLIKNVDCMLARQRTYDRVDHEHWTGLWEESSVELPGPSNYVRWGGVVS